MKPRVSCALGKHLPIQLHPQQGVSHLFEDYNKKFKSPGGWERLFKEEADKVLGKGSEPLALAVSATLLDLSTTSTSSK